MKTVIQTILLSGIGYKKIKFLMYPENNEEEPKLVSILQRFKEAGIETSLRDDRTIVEGFWAEPKSIEELVYISYLTGHWTWKNIQ